MISQNRTSKTSVFQFKICQKERIFVGQIKNNENNPVLHSDFLFTFDSIL